MNFNKKFFLCYILGFLTAILGYSCFQTFYYQLEPTAASVIEVVDDHITASASVEPEDSITEESEPEDVSVESEDSTETSEPYTAEPISAPVQEEDLTAHTYTAPLPEEETPADKNSEPENHPADESMTETDDSKENIELNDDSASEDSSESETPSQPDDENPLEPVEEPSQSDDDLTDEEPSTPTDEESTPDDDPADEEPSVPTEEPSQSDDDPTDEIPSEPADEEAITDDDSDIVSSSAPVDPDWTEVFPNEFVSQHPVTLPAPFEEAYETTVPDTTSVSIVIGPDGTLDMDEMIRLYGPALGDILERLPDYLMNPASSSALYD